MTAQNPLSNLYPIDIVCPSKLRCGSFPIEVEDPPPPPPPAATTMSTMAREVQYDTYSR